MTDRPARRLSGRLQFTLFRLMAFVTVTAIVVAIFCISYDYLIPSASLIGAIIGRVLATRRGSKTLVRFLWTAGVAATLTFAVCMCDPRLSLSERTNIPGLMFGLLFVVIFGIAAAVLLELLLLVVRMIRRYVWPRKADATGV